MGAVLFSRCKKPLRSLCLPHLLWSSWVTLNPALTLKAKRSHECCTTHLNTDLRKPGTVAGLPQVSVQPPFGWFGTCNVVSAGQYQPTYIQEYYLILLLALTGLAAATSLAAEANIFTPFQRLRMQSSPSSCRLPGTDFYTSLWVSNTLGLVH